VMDMHAAIRADHNRLLEYHMSLISGGVFFLPGRNGAISDAHSEEDLSKLLERTEEYVKQLGAR
ncbi:aspartate aminotransferase family protein, partial [Candidatus Bathyarchaeota archaeon]|nr:aspartate aminotransferase family protein [Candidatus Bathyarchaeota archaeon]